MGERLGKVAQVLAAGAELLGVEPEMVGVPQHLLEEEPGLLEIATPRQVVDPAIGAAGDVDTAIVVLRMASGRLCQITNSRRATYGYDQRIECHGSLGMARADNVTLSTVEVADETGFRRDPAEPFFLERYGAAYKTELAAFVDAVTAGTAPAPSGSDGLAALHLADCATESADTGQPVKI